MRFTISREQLQEGLAAVAASVPAKTTLPVLANILVETTEKGIRLSGTDLDIAVAGRYPAGALATMTVVRPLLQFGVAANADPTPGRFLAAHASASRELNVSMKRSSARRPAASSVCLSGFVTLMRAKDARAREWVSEADEIRPLWSS